MGEVGALLSIEYGLGSRSQGQAGNGRAVLIMRLAARSRAITGVLRSSDVNACNRSRLSPNPGSFWRRVRCSAATTTAEESGPNEQATCAHY